MSTNLVVLALSKYLIRDTPFARLCLLTLVSSFSLVISGFVSYQRSFAVILASFSISARCSSSSHPLSAMGTRSTRSSSKKSSSFLLPEEIDHLSALLETSEPPFNPDPQNTGAIPKKKPAKKTKSSNSDDPSASVENLIRLETLRKESLATQLQITETQLKLAQLNASIPSLSF